MRRLAVALGFLCWFPSYGQTTHTELRLTGDWTISIGTVALRIPEPEVVSVADERHETLPQFDPKAPIWRRGVRLNGVIAEECTVQGALDPDSVVVRDGEGPQAPVFRKGVDYEVDAGGTVGRLPGGKIQPGQPVFISYRHYTERIESIVMGPEGKILLKVGVPRTVTPEIPVLSAGEKRIANIYLSGRMTALTGDNLFPILENAYPEQPRKGPSIAEQRLPNTLKKLKSGERLRILAWGDSVTTFERYQVMFVNRLKERFPRTDIELITEAWGGRNTGSYLNEPPGSAHNYKEKVLAVKPDLIVSEFVNDAGLTEDQVEERYSRLLGDFREIGAEWIILTPHYVRPDWMKLTRQLDIDDDPRPYVKGLRMFAQKHQVALADASLRYGRLWRQGIPYLTLMENNINHPNVFGHSLFADSLMALFPTGR